MILNASGCLDALDGAGRRPRARRLRDEDGDAAAARGQPPGPDRRDRGRACSTRSGSRTRASTACSRDKLPRLAELGVPLWVSVGGFAADDYAELCAALDERREVTAIELNLSCPNVEEAPESAAEIVAAARPQTGKPLYAKLSPAATDLAGDRPRGPGRRRRRPLAREHDPRPRARRADAPADARARARAATPDRP